jgi:hypothetical protein
MHTHTHTEERTFHSSKEAEFFTRQLLDPTETGIVVVPEIQRVLDGTKVRMKFFKIE